MVKSDPRESPVEAHPDHEASDVNIGMILKGGAGLVVGGILVHLIILGFYGVLTQFVRQSQPVLSALQKQERKVLPGDLKSIPEPRLQQAEGGDKTALKASQEAKLNSYGWIDPQKGVVHIPIEQAMKRLAETKEKK